MVRVSRFCVLRWKDSLLSVSRQQTFLKRGDEKNLSGCWEGLFRVSVGQHGALPLWPVYACRQFPLLKQGFQMPWTWLNTEKLPRGTVGPRDADHWQGAMLPVCSVLGLSPGQFGPGWRRGCHLAQFGHSVTSSPIQAPERDRTSPAACLLSLQQPAPSKQTRNGTFPCRGYPQPCQPHASEGHNMARGSSSPQAT